jgi:hypothetical protein
MNDETKPLLVEFDLNQTPEEMMKLIEGLSIEALRGLDEAMTDVINRAKVASLLLKMEGLKSVIRTSDDIGTLQ